MNQTNCYTPYHVHRKWKEVNVNIIELPLCQQINWESGQRYRNEIETYLLCESCNLKFARCIVQYEWANNLHSSFPSTLKLYLHWNTTGKVKQMSWYYVWFRSVPVCLTESSRMYASALQMCLRVSFHWIPIESYLVVLCTQSHPGFN